MSDRDVMFRETAVCRFPDPEDREALQRFGALVLVWASAAGHQEEGRSTYTSSALAAAAADLRHLSSYLRAVVDEVEGSVVEPAEAHLGYVAKRWAVQAADLAGAIEAAVAETEAGGQAVDGPPGAAPASSTADLYRLADRLSWLQSALRHAKGAEAALRAIPEDGPDPDLHGRLIVRASDLGHELEQLLKEERATAGLETGS